MAKYVGKVSLLLMRNRELKFRAWHPKWKCFIYFNNLELTHESKYKLTADASNSISYHYWDEEAPLQQYTGVEDKNGKEIYEGDIIRYGIDLFKRVGWVSFFAGMFVCNWDDQTEDELAYMTTQDMVVIGNEFENPKLLK